MLLVAEHKVRVLCHSNFFCQDDLLPSMRPNYSKMALCTCLEICLDADEVCR